MDALDIGIAMLAIILLICVILTTDKNHKLEKDMNNVIAKANGLIKDVNNLTSNYIEVLQEQTELVKSYEEAKAEMNRLNRSYLAALPINLSERQKREDII